MTRSEIIPVLRGGEDEFGLAAAPYAEAALMAALQAARDAAPAVLHARHRRDAAAIRLQAEAARQKRRAILPPAAAAALSAAAAVALWLLGGVSAPAASGVPALALAADMAALGALAAIALQLAGDGRRRPPLRLAWLSAGLAALAATVALGAAAWGAGGGRHAAAMPIAAGLAAAPPWLFVRLPSAERKMLAAEFADASRQLAAAGERFDAAVAEARAAFEAEVAALAAGGSDGPADEPLAWRAAAEDSAGRPAGGRALRRSEADGRLPVLAGGAASARLSRHRFSESRI
jgi:hypothetical protein